MLDDGATEVPESVADVIGELLAKAPCQNCRLSLLHPKNRGVMYRGNPNGQIAILDIAPGAVETQQGIPLCGRGGQEFERWMRYAGVNVKQDAFVTSIIQCAPPTKKNKDGFMVAREPLFDEISACWYPRTLRLIQAMPNLECVITLGFPAAQALLGGKPIAKSHEGRWFVSSLLPGIPVFCLDHPDLLIAKPTPEKKGKLKVILDCFRREYVQTRKVVEIGKATSLQEAYITGTEVESDEGSLYRSEDSVFGDDV